MIPIDGEPLLERMVRQLLERDIKDIVIVGPPDDERYNIAGSHLYVPTRPREWGDASKFMNSARLWNPRGRTIIMYGDVCFTEEAMDTIVDSKEKDWILFARFEPPGECFAISFYGDTMIEGYQGLVRIYEWWVDGTLNRNGGWEWYRTMVGVPKMYMRRQLQVAERSYEINDLTDDFDFPGDHDRWIKEWNKQRL